MDRDAYIIPLFLSGLRIVASVIHKRVCVNQPKPFPCASPPCRRRRRLSQKKLHDPSTWRYAHEGGSTEPIRKEEEREELFAVGETREIPQ